MRLRTSNTKSELLLSGQRKTGRLPNWRCWGDTSSSDLHGEKSVMSGKKLLTSNGCLIVPKNYTRDTEKILAVPDKSFAAGTTSPSR